VRQSGVLPTLNQVTPLTFARSHHGHAGLPADRVRIPPRVDSGMDYIFRIAINSLQVGTDIGNTLGIDGVRRLSTITEATDYAEGVRRTAVAQFEELGSSVITTESYPSEVIDFRSPLTKMMGEDPDALLLSAQAETSGGTIVKQARELGYEGPIYSEVVPTGPGALSISGDAATGRKAVVHNPDLTTSTGKDLLANYKTRSDVPAPWFWYQGSAYDGVLDKIAADTSFIAYIVAAADEARPRLEAAERLAGIADE